VEVKVSVTDNKHIRFSSPRFYS